MGIDQHLASENIIVEMVKDFNLTTSTRLCKIFQILKRSRLRHFERIISLAEEAFAKVVDDLEEEREAPFPKRKEELKTGRPIN